MKILVFSDSHGAYHKMKAVVDMHPDARLMIFLGDGLRDADRLFDEYPDIPHIAVKGNCDLTGILPGDTYLDEQTADIDGKRIFCCHGHKYSVKSSELSLWLRAKEKGADIALFGHTHVPFERTYEGVTLFNPGSIGGGSFGLIYIEKDAHLVSHGKI